MKTMHACFDAVACGNKKKQKNSDINAKDELTSTKIIFEDNS